MGRGRYSYGRAWRDCDQGRCRRSVPNRSGDDGSREPRTRPGLVPSRSGHENAGVITEVGQSVHRLSVGQSVLVTANSSCGLCRTCMSGKDAFCVDRPPNYGYADNGGLAPFMKVRARDAMDCGSLNPIAAAPLADAGSTAYGAILDVRPYVRDDGSVLVIGIGGVGSTVVRLLRALTSVEVIAVDHPDKTEFAAQCGAHHFVPTTESTGEGAGKVMAMTGGRGVDATIDVVGSDQSLAFAGAVTASLGAISIVGLTGGTYQYGWTSQALGVRLFSSCTASLNELQELIRIFERTGMEIETSKYRFQGSGEGLRRSTRGHSSRARSYRFRPVVIGDLPAGSNQPSGGTYFHEQCSVNRTWRTV